jgi:hypothetical protein
MTDKIAEIRARYEDRKANEDRGWLLAEIERLRSDNERLRNEADLTRKALGTWALVPPDGGADPTHERVAAVVAEVERLRAILPPTAHSGVRNGPGEGSWSVFAEKVVDEREAARAEVERLREVLKIVRINGPDSTGLVWVSFSREGGVRVSFVVGHEEEMVSQALLEFEQIRRNALEAKP